ncbi:MAG TPA: Wzz/FepE/Etk N-terminal domain-containing protein [Candidatus Bathyarchaeia archaeon]|nr:Wzz/FepE/Etk N-terminal domain-containing protein [Candidatus Bathyarchaeia archaeon]
MPETYKTPEVHFDSEVPRGGAVPIPRIERVSRNREMDSMDLLLVLSRHKNSIVALTLGAAILAAIVSLLLPKTYTATTTILPPQENQSAATALVGQIGVLSGLSGADLGLKNPSDLFVALLKSRSVQDGIVNQYDLRRVYWVKRYEDARKKLDSRSNISAGDEGLISISVSDREPGRAAELANAYVDQLRSLNQNLAVSEAGQRRLFYEQKLTDEREDLARAELALKQAQEKTGLIQPDAQGRAIIDAVASTRAQVGIKEVQLQAMRTYATPNNPDLKRAEQELAGLRGQLAQLERSTGALGNGNLEIPTRRLPEVELDYIRRARDLKYHEALYDFLSKQLEAARIDEAKEAVVVQVVDRAVAPEKKSGPQRTLIVLVTLAVAFLLACFWALLAEAFRRRQSDPQERERFAQLRRSFSLPLRNL